MTDLFSDSDIPQIAPSFRFQWEEAQECYVLLYPEGMVKLNPSAGEILKRCDGDRSVHDIIADLKRQFHNASIDDDVRNFLKVAHENGWLQAKRTA